MSECIRHPGNTSAFSCRACSDGVKAAELAQLREENARLKQELETALQEKKNREFWLLSNRKDIDALETEASLLEDERDRLKRELEEARARSPVEEAAAIEAGRVDAIERENAVLTAQLSALRSATERWLKAEEDWDCVCEGGCDGDCYFCQARRALSVPVPASVRFLEAARELADGGLDLAFGVKGNGLVLRFMEARRAELQPKRGE